MGNKRQGSTSPLAPFEDAKLAKKKKGGTAAEKPTPEEWTVVQKTKKKEKSLLSSKDRRRRVEVPEKPHLQPPSQESQHTGNLALKRSP